MKYQDASYEQRIQRAIAQRRARGGDYGLIHEELDRRRQTWWEANRDTLRLSGPLPRQAYTMFLLEHLGLDAAETPVVFEGKRRIVWHSFNFCSTLEACIRLGLDTRQVCREEIGESVQRLVARLNQRLRFWRNHVDGILPYSPYREESIVLMYGARRELTTSWPRCTRAGASSNSLKRFVPGSSA